ncbi:hypothetical protein D3C81_1843840 [compost metagenome]
MGVNLLQTKVVAQQQFSAVDQLQHHEIADFRATDLTVGANPLGDSVASMAQHADHFFQTRQQVLGGMHLNVSRYEV